MCTPHETLSSTFACQQLRCTIQRIQDDDEDTYDMQFGTKQVDDKDDQASGMIYIAPQRVRVQIGTDASIVLGGPTEANGSDYYYSYEVPIGAYSLAATSSAIILAAGALLF